MGNTFFYRQVKTDVTKITWAEIFSDSWRSHTKRERDYALTAGTSFNTATEADMLQKWKKPWLWFWMLKWGLVLVVALYAVYFIQTNFTTTNMAIPYIMFLTITPLVTPVVLMTLLWELNIPRNISYFELFLYMLGGALISFVISAVLFQYISSSAAFVEEPAKLIASCIFLYIVSRKRNIYGVTGLVIGAAVGAGFSGFESVQYAFNYGEKTMILRAVLAVGGHVVYCAPYMAALALGMKNKKYSADAFVNPLFLMTFAASVVAHYVWNISSIFVGILLIVALWVLLLFIVKKCLYQVISIGQYRSGQGVSDNMFADEAAATVRSMPAVQTNTMQVMLVCVSGVLKGSIWQPDSFGAFTIGRGEENHIRFPQSANGISRKHCRIRQTSRGWVVCDLNSSYGTYLANGKRLPSGIEVPIQDGDYIYLGGKENVLQFKISR